MATVDKDKLNHDAFKYGMLQPLLKWRFMALFKKAELSKEAAEAITSEVEEVGFNAVKKELTFVVRQSIMTSLFEAIGDLVSLSTGVTSSITILVLDGGGKVDSSVTFIGVKAELHDFKLEYGNSSDAAKHKIVFKYEMIKADHFHDAPKTLEDFGVTVSK